jgi:hypothetical protein
VDQTGGQVTGSGLTFHVDQTGGQVNPIEDSHSRWTSFRGAGHDL